eukprot:gene19285-21211_t
MSKHLEQNMLDKLYEDVKKATKAIANLELPCEPEEFDEFVRSQSPLNSITNYRKQFYDIEENSTDQTAKSTVAAIYHHLSMDLPKQVTLFLKKAIKFLPTFFEREQPHWDCLAEIWMPALCNLCDKHKKAQKSCCRDGLVSFIFQEMLPRMTDIEWGKQTKKEKVMESSMILVYNCCKLSENLKYYEEVNAVDKLVKLRNDTNYLEENETNVTALLTLGYLIDESNNDKIICGHATIETLIRYLRKCLANRDHESIFYAEEIAHGLRHLSAPDENKKLICETGGHEVLAKLLFNAMNDKEIIASCHALWSLCFSEKGRLLTQENQDLMKKLKELSENEKTDVKEAAVGVLWQLKQYEEKEKTAVIADSGRKGAGYIMLSYQWDNQKVVKDIADALTKRGYNVWIDVEKIQGNIIDAMADAVEQAAVIIICMSKRYQRSNNCRAEAQYSHKLEKKMIPLMMENNYKPDGWLGLLLGCELYTDFTTLEKFTENMELLCRQLDTNCPALLTEAPITQNAEKPVQAANEPYRDHHPLTSPDCLDSPASNAPTAEIKNQSINDKKLDEISQWSNADVEKWLRENSLIGALKRNRLRKLTGIHLVMFYNLRRECPKRYYDRFEVRQDLGFHDLLDFLAFTNHIGKLFE